MSTCWRKCELRLGVYTLAVIHELLRRADTLVNDRAGAVKPLDLLWMERAKHGNYRLGMLGILTEKFLSED